ncbi:MAG: diguanylate cyclase [Gammaproteobacteria bacterium]|nr:diguanylate cyclase [Gammaproteobacteria bacterium]
MLKKKVANTKVKNNAGDVLPRVTISTGISAIGKIDRESEDTLIELIAASDEALYRAKKDGRNCVSG